MPFISLSEQFEGLMNDDIIIVYVNYTVGCLRDQVAALLKVDKYTFALL